MFGLLKREVLALTRRRADVINPLAFMFLAVMLFAIASPGQSDDGRYVQLYCG